jgi:hypothetical protein
VHGIAVIDGRCNRIDNRPDIPEAEWSGFDQGGYPVFTSEGKLFRRLQQGDRLLADFNGLTPDPQPAPPWAKTPLPTLGKGFAATRRGRR